MKNSFLAVVFLTLSGLVSAGPTVLLLNSYHPQYTWTAENTRGVRDRLKGIIDDEDLHIEFMDGRRFLDDDVYLQHLIQTYRHKYQSFKPDLIISTDDYALNFLMEHRNDIFGEVPVVFSGVNSDPIAALEDKKDYTGILEGESIKETLELIFMLQKKDLTEILVLSDQSSLGKQFSARFKDIQASWKHPEVKLTLVDNFSYEELLYRLNHLTDDKAVLLTAIHKDNHGRYFSYERDIPPLTRYSRVPVYGMWGSPLLGLGVMGGYMNDPYENGFSTAEIAIQVLHGSKAGDIPIREKAGYRPVFDYRILNRFSVSSGELPENSTIRFGPDDFFFRYKWLVIGVTVSFIILTGIILLLMAQVSRRKTAEQELAALNRKLEQEVERRTEALESANRALLQVNKRMESLANTDDLTMIPNRRHGHRILSRLDYEDDQETFTVALIDVDHFKEVNDNHGHDTGDKVLQQISHAITGLIRPGDTLCRWGGEEFLLIMPATDTRNAQLVCERVRRKISKLPVPPVESISISCGLSSREQARTLNTLLRQADEALYRAKSGGRNQTIVYRAN